MSSCALFNVESTQIVSKMLSIKKAAKIAELTGKLIDDSELVQTPVCDLKRLFQELSRNRQIISLNMSKNKFLTDNDTLTATFGYNWDSLLRSFYTFGNNNKTMTHLNLSYCDMTDAGVSSLFEGMNTNPKSQLKWLSLKGNRIHDTALLDQLLPYLAKGKDKTDPLKRKYTRFHACETQHDNSCK